MGGNDLDATRHGPTAATRWLCVVLVGWLLIAVVAGATGAVAKLRPPAPQLALAGLVVSLLSAYCALRPFRRALASLPIDAFVAAHLVRFVGVYFLVLYSAGRLPYAFAVPGGVGDIVVAVGAALLLAARSAPARLYAVWNIVGLVDILFVVVTAARLAIADADSMAELLRFPLSLLPTFVVPLIIFSHVVIAHRLLTNKKTSRATAPSRRDISSK